MPSVCEQKSSRVPLLMTTAHPPPQKLRIATAHEINSRNNLLRTADTQSSSDESRPQDVDEPWPYSFRSGDPVWVRSPSGDWQSGVVSGQIRIGQTRQKEGLFYPVIYADKVRKYFAPQNGEIKPDTLHTRRLLEDAGWL